MKPFLSIKSSALCGVTLAALTLTTVLPAQAGTVTLTWKDTCKTEQGFKIERANSQNGPWTQIATAPANTTTFPDTTAASGMTYYYRVRAYNGTWNSGYTNIAAKACIPAPPTGVTATAGATGTKKITLTWQGASGATGYTVYRATSYGGTYSQVGTSAIASFVNSGLTAGSTYWYRVTANNAGGASAQTGSVSTTAR